MKKYTIILLLLPLMSLSQPYLSTSIGISDVGSVIDFRVGYEVKKVVFEGTMITHLDRVNAAYFGAITGYNIPIGKVFITPSFGYYYRLMSNDKKYQNGTTFQAGIRAEYNNITISYYGMDGMNFFALGFRKHIIKTNKYGK